MCTSSIGRIFGGGAPAPAPIIQAPPPPPPTPEDPVKPMASPEDLKAKNTTGAVRAASRRSLRIDLAGSAGGDGAAGLNVPQ